VAPENFGGGRANHDQRYVDDTVTFLKTVDTSKPFCLIVSLVNPHDISSFPGKYESADYPDSMLKGDLELPPTVSENLSNNYKPKAHAEVVNKLAVGLGPLPTSKRQYEYLNFYGNLLKKVDGQIGQILDAIDAQSSLAANTLIFRFADHGEMGLAHGNMRQKMFNVYEETIRVPLVVSNPARYSTPQQSDALVSLIDILPTVATMAQVPDKSQWDLRGTDFSPILNGSQTDVQDSVLFTFDDVRAGTEMNPMVSAPNRIRCIREKNWKFARYFDGDGQATAEYEMYDLVNDPLEQQNLAHPQHPRYNEPAVITERSRLEQKLAAVESQKLSPLSTDVRGSNNSNQPEEMILIQNYPNPFNQSTRISIRLTGSGMVKVDILNINGQIVATLTEKIYSAGNHELTWDGNIASGRMAPTGTYFCQVTFGNMSTRHKLQLVR
jgi:arylsulfatase A-like enzyme